MARPSKVPKPLQPMLATLIDAPFDNRDWVFETKWDGFRLVAKIENRSVTLYSRSGLIVSDNYKPIAKALEKVKQDAVIDGELVALDAHGISRFQLLQNALRTSANLHYCVFDIMFLDGEDLRGLPLVERKKRLQALLPKDPLLIYSEHWPEHGKRLFKEAQKLGLEGIMAKRAAEPIPLRCAQQGLAQDQDWQTAGGRDRRVHGAAPITAAFRIAGARRARQNGWRYVGHVGTGFSHAMLEELHAKLLPLRTASHPSSSV